jgi:hypothetical protein
MKEENMKQRTFNKKLVINKVTIANLSDKEKAVIRGGGTVQGGTCDGTVHGRTCDQAIEAAVEGTVQRQICDGTVHGRTCDELS